MKNFFTIVLSAMAASNATWALWPGWGLLKMMLSLVPMKGGGNDNTVVYLGICLLSLALIVAFILGVFVGVFLAWLKTLELLLPDPIPQTVAAAKHAAAKHAGAKRIARKRGVPNQPPGKP